MVSQIAKHDGALGTLQKQVDTIKEYLESPDCEFPYITLLVHNLESPGLSKDEIQSAIASLAESPKIFLISSTDHLNSAILWDSSKISSFNFIQI